MKSNKILKILVLVFTMMFFGADATFSSYIDSSTSNINTFGAGSVDLIISDENSIPLDTYFINAEMMRPEDTVISSFKIRNQGTLPFEYTLSSSIVSGNSDLFNEIVIKIETNGSTLFEGNLNSLTSSPRYLDSGLEEIIGVTIRIPSSISPSLQLKEIISNIDIRAEQIGPLKGFYDIDNLTMRITTTDWTAPIIDHILIASPNDSNSLKVTWNTDELATSNVEVGLTDIYGLNFPTIQDITTNNTQHSVELLGLGLNTEYHFRIISTDSYGNTSLSGDYTFRVTLDGVDLIPRYGVVLNEILPNPIGPDAIVKPGGEWVELYNKAHYPIDISNWKVCTRVGCININSSNTIPSTTVIQPYNFLVVYIEEDYINGMLRNDWDIVSLFNHRWNLKDIHSYSGTQEGKSLIRYPDGGYLWFDPIPSPGLPNNLDPIEIETDNSEPETPVNNQPEILEGISDPEWIAETADTPQEDEYTSPKEEATINKEEDPTEVTSKEEENDEEV